MKSLAIAFLSVLLAAGSFLVSGDASVSGPQELRRVSIVAVIASPRQYDGMRVYVTGYLHLAYESDAVYLHKDDFRYGMTKNAIRIILEKGQRDRFRSLSDAYVIVEGTFTDDSANGMFSGSIVDVTRMQKLLTEEELARQKPNSPNS